MLSRKENALSIATIRNVLHMSCGCDRKCNDELDVDTVLRWRKKYHSLTMGYEQRSKLLDLYKESVFFEGRSKTLHFVEGKLICR